MRRIGFQSESSNSGVLKALDRCRLARAEAAHMGQDRVGGMRVQIDNAALLAALPLAPSAHITIPILLHALQVLLWTRPNSIISNLTRLM